MKKEKIRFSKGITRINFPVLFPGDFRDEISKIEKMKLPKHTCIGFEARYYRGKVNFDVFEVFIEK